MKRKYKLVRIMFIYLVTCQQIWRLRMYTTRELRYPMCIICIRRGTNIAIEANVRTIT